MKTKKGSGKNATIRLLMILPVVAVLIIFLPGCSKNNKPSEAGLETVPPPPPPPPPVAENSTDSVFTEVDELPVFKGGDEALLKYIAENTIYPELAKKNGTQGKIIVRFAVNVDGSVDKISVLKGVDPELDKEAVRVVSTLPAFEKPGKKDGKTVPVWFMIPINFTLR